MLANCLDLYEEHLKFVAKRLNKLMMISIKESNLFN